MGTLKLWIVSIMFLMAIAGTRSENKEKEIHVDVAEPVNSDSFVNIEIEQLKLKISSLESAILEKTRGLQSSEENIAHLETEIQKKAGSVASLQSEVELLQKNKAVEAEESVRKAHALSNELETKIEKLRNEIEEQNNKRKVLEDRATEAEKKVLELNMKLGSKKGAMDTEELIKKTRSHSDELEKKVEKLGNEVEEQNRQRKSLESRTMVAEKKVEELNFKLKSLEETNNEQKHKIQKTAHAIQLAEEELMRVQLEAMSKSKELKEVPAMCLPPWIAYHVTQFQDLAAHHWHERGEPLFNALVQKVVERSDQAQKWIKPHLETTKTKWIPIAKTRWIVITEKIKPHMEKACRKAVEVIEVCRNTATPHIVKLQEISGPYIQEVRRFSKPYIEQAATITKPHAEKARIFLKPYTKKVIYGYERLLKTSRDYHHKIQETLKQHLKNYEFTKHLATKELIWFVASASLALPIFLLYQMLSSILVNKKAPKRARGARSHTSHRRHKRRHADQ